MRTLLIVDDEENQRLLYRREFEEDGYRVVTAADGKEAIGVIEREDVDLVVLDIRMPRMDGLEAVGEMLARQSGLPVVLHTAFLGYKEDFMSWAADAYVIKSSDLKELKAKVRELLEQTESGKETSE